MDKALRKVQLKILKVFSQFRKTFALSGGSALELFYLKHRFSKDLDFFSSQYKVSEIDKLVKEFNKVLGEKLKLENELNIEGKAKVRFYVVDIKEVKSPLKIDFIEDVIFKKPTIKRFNQIPVYDVKNIYYQKILALIGTRLKLDDVGKEIFTGRGEARDIVDLYYLSKKVCPLHKFVKKIPLHYKRGLIYWYRTYSREEFKIEVLALDIYDKNFDSKEVIRYFDREIEKITEEVL